MDAKANNKKTLPCFFSNVACLLFGAVLGVGGYHLVNEQNLLKNINLPVTPITSITKSASEGTVGVSATSEMLDAIINNGEPPTCESIRSHVMLKAYESGLNLGPKEFNIIETQCLQLENLGLEQVMDTGDQPEQSAAPADVSPDKIKAQIQMELENTENQKDDLEY